MSAVALDAAATRSKAIGPDRSLLVLLHGIGSSREAMGWLAHDLSMAMPSISTFAPDAPHRFDMAPSRRQWFSLVGITEQNRAERAMAAVDQLIRRIEEEQDRLGLSWDRTAVLGFSQGAILALTMAATLDVPPASTVALGGRLPPPVAPARTARGHVLVSHGTADSVMPYVEMDRAAELLRSLGCKVETLGVYGHGHSIAASQVEATIRAISVALAVEGHHVAI